MAVFSLVTIFASYTLVTVFIEVENASTLSFPEIEVLI